MSSDTKRGSIAIEVGPAAKAASTGGIVIDARARMGYTAPIGSTDQDPVRHLTVALPPASSKPRRPAPATPDYKRSPPKRSREVCFQDGGRRAGSLEEVRFTDVEHLEFDV